MEQFNSHDGKLELGHTKRSFFQEEFSILRILKSFSTASRILPALRILFATTRILKFAPSSMTPNTKSAGSMFLDTSSHLGNGQAHLHNKRAPDYVRDGPSQYDRRHIQSSKGHRENHGSFVRSSHLGKAHRVDSKKRKLGCGSWISLWLGLAHGFSRGQTKRISKLDLGGMER